MSALVTRVKKGMADVGRCLLPTTIPPRQPRRVSNFRSPAAVLLAASSPAGELGGHVVERVGSDVTAIFLHLGREFGDDTAQHFTKAFGSVAPSVIGFAHERNHEGSHDREVVNLCQGFGNVCRA